MLAAITSELIESQTPLRANADNVQHNGSVKNITVTDESNNEVPAEIDAAKGQKPAEEEPPCSVGLEIPKGETPYLGRSTVDLSGENSEFKLLVYPLGETCFSQATWIITWPIHLVFRFTIPDCEKPKFKTWFPLTFFMCIVWIGSLSYLVAWFITIVGMFNKVRMHSQAFNAQFSGDTLRIPDSVMGITFLAAGTSVPEAVSSVIVAKQGTLHTKFIEHF